MKSIVRTLLAAAGWELRRARRPTDVLYRDPRAAIYRDSSLIRVESDACTDKLGFNYGRWHPWSEATAELLQRPGTMRYDESVLSKFYDCWEFPVIHDVFAPLIPDEKYRNAAIKSAEERVTSLSHILGETPDFARVNGALREGFARALGVELEEGSLNARELEDAARFEEERYSRQEWNFKR